MFIHHRYHFGPYQLPTPTPTLYFFQWLLPSQVQRASKRTCPQRSGHSDVCFSGVLMLLLIKTKRSLATFFSDAVHWLGWLVMNYELWTVESPSPLHHLAIWQLWFWLDLWCIQFIQYNVLWCYWFTHTPLFTCVTLTTLWSQEHQFMMPADNENLKTLEELKALAANTRHQVDLPGALEQVA